MDDGGHPKLGKPMRQVGGVGIDNYCLLRGEAQLACQSDGLDCVAPAGDHTDDLLAASEAQIRVPKNP